MTTFAFYRKHLSSRKSVAVFAALVLFSLLATLVPYAVARFRAGDSWKGVTPSLSYDGLRYYARANDVLRGHFFAHDPYSIEHSYDPSPTPSIDDALVEFPIALTGSFNAGYYLSIFFWCLLFLMLTMRVLVRLGVHVPFAMLGAFFVYIGVYGDMLRPGAMQIVFPFFLLFLFMFYRFLEGERKSIIPLGVVTALGAYSYVFLFMVALASIGVYWLMQLIRKDHVALIRATLAGALGVVVALPHYIYVAHLAQLPFYQESIVRLVFFYTHFPQMEVYYYGRWFVVGFLFVYLMRKYFPTYVHERTAEFLQYTGAGIIIALISNIVLGRDFDIAVHVARFGIVWYLVVGVALVAPLLKVLARERGEIIKKLNVSILFLLLFMQMLLNIPRAVGPLTSLEEEHVVALQQYAGVIDWFAGKEQSVVVGPHELMMYLPVLTKQYVLYTSHSGIFLMSDNEIRERYMLYHAFDRLTEEQFVQSFDEYMGLAPGMLAQVSRERYQLCTLLRPQVFCAPAQSSVDFIDSDAFKAQYHSYYSTLPMNVLSEYAKYHVRYVVRPATEPLKAELTVVCAEVYRDKYYAVCELASPAPL